MVTTNHMKSVLILKVLQLLVLLLLLLLHVTIGLRTRNYDQTNNTQQNAGTIQPSDGNAKDNLSTKNTEYPL
jgi:hypothetical protein